MINTSFCECVDLWVSLIGSGIKLTLSECDGFKSCSYERKCGVCSYSSHICWELLSESWQNKTDPPTPTTTSLAELSVELIALQRKRFVGSLCAGFPSPCLVARVGQHSFLELDL